MKFKNIEPYTSPGQWECDYPIDRIVAVIEEFEEEDKLDLNPDFQRGHVWTEEQQIKYVEFILRGGKTGRVIYLNHPKWRDGRSLSTDGFVCVDGLQRITALKRFIRNEIQVFGCYYAEFEDKPRGNTMKININHLQTRKEVLTWYLEMNGGGTPHSQEELDRVRMLIGADNNER